MRASQHWKSNYTRYIVWYENNFPFPNFSGRAVEVWEWINNFIHTLLSMWVGDGEGGWGWGGVGGIGDSAVVLMLVISLPNDFCCTYHLATLLCLIILSDHSCYGDEHFVGCGGWSRLQLGSRVHVILHVDWEYIPWGHRLHVQGEFTTHWTSHMCSTARW